MKSLQLIVAMLGLLTMTTSAKAESCPKNLKPIDLAAQGFRLDYVGLYTPSKKKLDIDSLYFSNKQCECGFRITTTTKLSDSDIGAALRSKKGLAALAAKMNDVTGECPASTNITSPWLHCFNTKATVCRGLK
jgi:hypothetical protein